MAGSALRPAVSLMPDAVIIGSGAGGAPLALTLAQAGLEVLVLEKGPRFSREDYARDGSGISPEAFLPSLSEDPHTVVTRATRTPTRTHLGWIASCVGGGTAHMGGYLYRLHPDDFRLASRFGRSSGLVDWPFGYAELEPYYTRAEREIGISGRSPGPPFEGPRSHPYPMPPLHAHPLAAAVDEACRRRGLHPFPTPRAVNSRTYGGRPACAYCSLCASFGCPVGARGSTQEAILPRAEATGRCRVLARSMVCEITVDRAGRATGCVYHDAEGAEHAVSARVVCVAASAVESARLLLLSGSSRFPHGLANSSGRVGRHLQFHSVSFAQACFPLDRSPGDRLANDPSPFLGVSVMDHYFLPPGVAELPKGGVLRFDRAAGRLRRREADRPDAGVLYCEIFHDFLANPDTWVGLDPEVTDRWGLPVARISLDRPAHHVEAGRFLADRALEILGDIGGEEPQVSQLSGIVSHLVLGTCRAGNDPETSVVDGFCRTHEVPNLYVVDGSFFPTSGGAAPTLTLLAQSFRVGEHLVERFRRGELA